MEGMSKASRDIYDFTTYRKIKKIDGEFHWFVQQAHLANHRARIMNVFTPLKMADGDELDDKDDVKTPNHDNGEIDMEDTDELQELEDIVEHCSQEYLSLNNTLDQLDCCLDTLEQRNNGLFAQLKDLLDSTRSARHELQMLNSDAALSPSDHPKN